MNREAAENIARLAAYLAQRPTYHSDHGDLSPVPPHVAAREAVALASIARKMHRLDEDACNGERNGVELTEWEHNRIEQLYQRKVEQILTRFGLIFYRQTDPRGWPLYIGTKGELDPNDYNRTGLAVTPHARG